MPTPEFYVKANDPAQIYHVILGGGAEAAGVRAGDRILMLNGLPFDANRLPQITRGLQVGRTAVFTLRRPGGSQFSTPVPLVPLANITSEHLLRFSLIAVAFWGLSLLLLLRRSEQPTVRLLFLLAQAIAVGALIPSMGFIIWCDAIVWKNLSGVMGGLSAPLLLHFHCSLPVVLGTPGQRRWWLGLAYGLALAAAAAWILVNYGLLPYGVALASLVCVAFIIAVAMVVLIYVYLRRASPDGRRRLRLILIGNLLAGGPTVFLYILPVITLGYPLVPDVALAFCLAAAPAAYVIATVRHSLFGIDRFLNRALVYAVIALAIFTIYAGPLILLDRFMPFGWLRRALVMGCLTLLVALAFDWTRRRVQRLVDQIFYGSWYDYPKVVELVSAALARTLDWHELSDVLTRQVPGLMRLRSAQLITGNQAPQHLDAADQTRLRFPLGGEGQTHAVWIIGPRHDGDEFTATDRRILKTLARQADIAVKNVRLVQTLRRQLDEIRDSRKTLTRLEHQLLRMREEERQHLARELHDGPIQTLVGVNMQLGLLAASPEVGTAATPLACALSGMQSEVRTLLADLRQVCADLRPPMLDTLGLGAALRALTHEWSAQHEISVELDLSPDAVLQVLPGEVTVNLYRMVQEAFSNIARHAGAHNVWLSLKWAGLPDSLSLSVRDDGQGFAVAPRPADHGHFGLAAMQERAALIGGQWRLDSAPGQGTRISVIWQHTAKNSAAST